MPIAIIRILATLGSIVAVFFSAKKLTETSERTYWNKGVCKKCGGHFKLIEGTIDAPSKGYKCDVCDNCVWITHNSDMGYKYTPSKATLGGCCYDT